MEPWVSAEFTTKEVPAILKEGSPTAQELRPGGLTVAALTFAEVGPNGKSTECGGPAL